MFELSKEYEFEAIGDERPNVVISDPAPKCALATRKDTGDWFVATGVYFKPVESLDGTTFRDIDGGIWRLLVTNKAPSPATTLTGEVETPAPVTHVATPADQIVSQIETLFPNWRSYRDLIDCIECTLHDFRKDAGREA